MKLNEEKKEYILNEVKRFCDEMITFFREYMVKNYASIDSSDAFLIGLNTIKNVTADLILKHAYISDDPKAFIAEFIREMHVVIERNLTSH